MIKFPFNVYHDILGKGQALSLIKRGNELFVRVLFPQRAVKEFHFPLQFKINMKAEDERIQYEILVFGEKIEWTYPLVLHEGRILAKSGGETYNICSNYLGWDDSKGTAFMPQGLMYAEKATPEKYSVWMIVHNSLIEPVYNGTSSWYNVVKGDTIEEIWYTDRFEVARDLSIRVAFLKTKDGYMFKGLYSLKEVEMREISGKPRMVKIYKMISSKYPARPEGM